MTVREPVDAKAARYLATGRLTVLHRDGDHVAAECLGDGGTYRLGHSADRPGAWSCSCPATGRCAHVVALQLVVIPTDHTTHYHATGTAEAFIAAREQHERALRGAS